MKDINKYLEVLIGYANGKLNPSFNIDQLALQKFELVNSYLIYQTLKDKKQKKSTLIYIPDKDTKSQFYLPVIFTLAIYNFTDNYIDNITDFRKGKTVQKDGQRYRIFSVNSDKYELTKEDKSRLKITVNRKGIEKYLITTNAKISNRLVKLKLDLYKSFFSSILREDIRFFPSQFKYKSIIVTDKKIVAELKKYEMGGEKIHKAFPFQYVTKSGKQTDNIPIDPMIYIVNDYETARTQILDKGITIRNITFIGQNKYRENHLEIAGDLRDNKYENCIIIGNADVPENAIPKLLKWKWSLPELDYFNYIDTYEIEKIIVENEPFSNSLKEFDCVLERIEKENYGIDLKELYKFVRNLLPIIVPSPESRLLIQLDNALLYFEKEGEDIVETTFDEIGEYDYEEVWKQISEAYIALINSKKQSYFKFNKLQEFDKIDYLVVSKEFLNEWKDEVESRKIRKIISFKEFKEINKIEKNKRIVFLGFFGYTHLESMLYSSNKIYILLYHQEMEYFDSCFGRIKRENYTNIGDPDRKELSEISFKETEQIENISDLIKRLFKQDDDSIINPDYLDSCLPHFCRELTFENDVEKLVLDDNKTVLLSINRKKRFEKVKNLAIGDKIRVYDNSSKQELYQVALNADSDGEFTKIEKFSKLWKTELNLFYAKYNSLNELHQTLVKQGLSIKNPATLSNWINPNSNVKFPQKKRDLSVLKKVINSTNFTENYPNILKSRRLYNGIMIALGRDFSDEISGYIQKNKKGELLKQFSEKQIQQFVNQNARERVIKIIKPIDYEQ